MKKMAHVGLFLFMAVSSVAFGQVDFSGSEDGLKVIPDGSLAALNQEFLSLQKPLSLVQFQQVYGPLIKCTNYTKARIGSNRKVVEASVNFGAYALDRQKDEIKVRQVSEEDNVPKSWTADDDLRSMTRFTIEKTSEGIYAFHGYLLSEVRIKNRRTLMFKTPDSQGLMGIDGRQIEVGPNWNRNYMIVVCQVPQSR